MESDSDNAGDSSETAYTKLWSTNRRLLRAYISQRLSNASLVDDVLQEVSVILWEKFETYRAGTNFLAWAKAVAHFRILRACYDQKKRPASVTPELLELMEPDTRPFEEEVDERIQFLKICMRKLTAEDRDLILMRYEKKLEGKKIAEQLMKRPNYIYKRIGSIRQQLHRCIKGRAQASSKHR